MQIAAEGFIKMHLKEVRNVCSQVKLPFRLSFKSSPLFFLRLLPLPRQPLLNFLLLLEEVRSSPSFVEEDFRPPAENCEAFRAIGEGQGPFPLISLYLLRHAAQPRAHHSADVWPPSRRALFICAVVYSPPPLALFSLLPAIKHAVEFPFASEVFGTRLSGRILT